MVPNQATNAIKISSPSQKEGMESPLRLITRKM